MTVGQQSPSNREPELSPIRFEMAESSSGQWIRLAVRSTATKLSKWPFGNTGRFVSQSQGKGT